ncbi:hypothetical protein SCLCIDRAFT_21051 [Scleroderma citrinum Foug A]|uniref:Uncharacterized protein n=1 Tax=Scleroderma citrinum Foug A TaxID=1036808 RepID=A0A0C3EGU0_9AGAM|nr:hypothetical protein SCLCIDRAFT_21051 [Scleroderma citrinum Foug A]
MFPASPTSFPAQPPSPALSTFLVDPRKQLDVINQLLRELGECTQTASQLLDLVCYTPLSNHFPSSPFSSVSSFSNVWTPTSNAPPSPVFQRLDLSYTSSSVQAQFFASRQLTPSLATSPHPIDPNSLINPNGLFGSFTPGKLSLDSHTQHIHNGFVYNVPLPGETGQLYLVTVGR